jgi:hypothetical protein
VEVRINKISPLVWIALALVLFGVIMRLLPHPANLAPVGAIALFGGAVLPRRYGWWLPLIIMMASDIFLGFYSGIVFTWLGFLLVGLFGMTLRDQSNWLRVPFGALAGAVIFFMVSNFGVWVQSGMYVHSWAGLVLCYEMALPFFRNTFLGDLLYSGLLFGVYALATRFVPQPRTVE